MTDQVSDSMKAKILKLLAMTAERGATEAEALVAMSKAQQLLEQYNLSIASLRGAGEKKDHRESERFPGFPWARDIASAVAKLYDCRHLYYKGGDQRKMEQVFVGRQSNAETARIIAEFVVQTVLRLGLKYQREVSGTNRQAHDFQVGASQRICDRANALWREANADLIKERQAEAARRQALRPDVFNLKPGTYTLTTLTATWNTKVRRQLQTVEAMVWVKELLANPPKGVYTLGVLCTEGELCCGETYYYAVRELPQKQGRSVTQAKDAAAYEAGAKAGADVGLHIQVNGNVNANKLT